MKIQKIDDIIDVDSQDIELQGCANDCKNYHANSKGDYEYLKRLGLKADGEATVQEIMEYKDNGFTYCYRTLTAKTCIFW